MPVDERRRLLLERATELFATHGYDELSMAKLARAAGISKPLLYHYFPGKRHLFEAVLTRAAEDHIARVAPTDPDAPVAEQLAASLDTFLRWVEANGATYEKLIRSAGIPEVRATIDRVREETAQRILDGVGGGDVPQVRAAVRGWLWAMDGVLLDWVRERDMTRAEVHGLLVGMLLGALTAAGHVPAALG